MTKFMWQQVIYKASNQLGFAQLNKWRINTKDYKISGLVNFIEAK